jgi:hypothetical protein
LGDEQDGQKKLSECPAARMTAGTKIDDALCLKGGSLKPVTSGGRCK